MIGPILVFAVAVTIVATYVTIVNRLLRSDKHWSESNQQLARVSRKQPVILTVTTPARGSASLTPNRI